MKIEARAPDRRLGGQITITEQQVVLKSAAMAALLVLIGPAATARPPSAVVSNEARTNAYLQKIVDSPPRLRIFLQAMPKGADLHNHQGGANYAEDYLRWAAEDGLCLETERYHVEAPPCDVSGRVPAARLELDYPRYARAIEAFSTRGFEAGVGDPTVSGYDRFFATFGAFSGAYREGKAMAATRRQAAADRVSYIELSTGARAGSDLAALVGDVVATDFAVLWTRIAPLLPQTVAAARAEYDRAESEAQAIEGCAGATPSPACGVQMRYLYTALRTEPPARVFAQLALGFAIADADPRFVGVNIAAPEHDPVAIRDYALHMRMLAYLRSRYPKVPLSLHAGELTLGLVPPRDLAFHIRDAVDVAGARRIGHGIDISYETDATSLLKQMARDGIAVEINLTSNAVILGVKGRDHPLSLYRQAGVPVVLSTDDEGVSRSDMTNEYLRAVTEQGLGYLDLKQIVRDGLQYAFLPGASLWRDRAGGARVAACGAAETATCAAFLRSSPKAAQQWRLERDLAAFEAVAR